MPSELTSRLSSGAARYSGGLAGLAKCRTPSTRPSTGSLVAHVGAHEREARVLGEVREVLQPAGREVVDRDDLVAAREERVAEVRPDEPGAARDDDARHYRRPTPW